MQLRATQIIFALTMIGIGVIGIATGGFAPIWAGVPKSLPDRQLLAYLCAFVSLVCGAGLFARRVAVPASLVLFIYLALWTLLFKVPFIIREPLVEVSYQSTGENLVLVAAAWIIYASVAKRPALLVRQRGSRLACVLYGFGLVAFGFSHFAYLDLTAPLVPKWLGVPVFWAYLTAAIYVVTGIALVTGFAVRLAALVAAVQIALITLLVWGPVVVRGGMSPGDFQESVVSWALTAGALVIAGSFEGRAWIPRVGRRAGLEPDFA